MSGERGFCTGEATFFEGPVILDPDLRMRFNSVYSVFQPDSVDMPHRVHGGRESPRDHL
jgi:hypothetical protein